MAAILSLVLGGCSHTKWENIVVPDKVKPSSAAAKPESLNSKEMKYLKKDKTGRVIGQKFDKNKRNLTQSNRWINYRKNKGWF